jgi:hypothetical protein
MPDCIDHGPMVKCFSGFEVIGVGWERHNALFEDWVCSVCGFRVRQHFRIENFGKRALEVNTK